MRCILEACSVDEADDSRRADVIRVTIEMVDRIRQEISKVGFWKNSDRRELLTKRLVRDLDTAGICQSGKERELAQQLVALAKENHEHLKVR